MAWLLLWTGVLHVLAQPESAPVAQEQIQLSQVLADVNKPVIELTRPSWMRGKEDTPVERHGDLKVVGRRTVDGHGNDVVLNGVSLFWSQWGGKFWNEDVVEHLARDWKVSVIRCAMAVEDGGYLEHPEREKKKVQTVVDAAIKAGIYVIIDWHDHMAHKHQGSATTFFREVAKQYGHVPNVIFEPYNEPTYVDWKKEVKPYHEHIVRTIRRYSDNLIILGTPHWCQDIDVAAKDPVNASNVAYSLHFYAATHGGTLRKKVRQAVWRGIAVQVTEWGTCAATGNGTLDFGSSSLWLDFLKEHNISAMGNWAITDKKESCAALKPGASARGYWGDSTTGRLTYSGAWVRSWLAGKGTNAVKCDAPGWPCVKPLCAHHNSPCKEEKCCHQPGDTCFRKDAGWAVCLEQCRNKPGEPEANWTCSVLTKSTTAKPTTPRKTNRTVPYAYIEPAGPNPPAAVSFRRFVFLVLTVALPPFVIGLVCIVVMWKRGVAGYQQAFLRDS